MKLSPQIKNILTLIRMLFILFVLFAGCNYLLCIIFPKPLAVAEMVIIIVFVSIAFYRRGLLNITSVYFDEKGFTFYDLFGKIDFCAWESIERVEHFFEHIDHLGRAFSSHPIRNPEGRVAILVYTKDRYFRPEMKEDNIITTRDRKGRRIFPNARNSFIAWVFSHHDKEKLYDHLQKYRPDLHIERHESTI